MLWRAALNDDQHRLEMAGSRQRQQWQMPDRFVSAMDDKPRRLQKRRGCGGIGCHHLWRAG
jgi:hypothetical protein